MAKQINPVLRDIWQQAAEKRNSGGLVLEGDPKRLYALKMALYRFRRDANLEPNPFTDIINTLSISHAKGSKQLKIETAAYQYQDITIVE